MLSGIILKFLVAELKKLERKQVKRITRWEKIYQFKMSNENLFVSIDQEVSIVARAKIDIGGEKIMRHLWRDRLLKIESIGWERILKITIGREPIFFFLAKGARLKKDMIVLPADDRVEPDDVDSLQFQTKEDIIHKVKGVDTALAAHIIKGNDLGQIIEGMHKGTMRYDVVAKTILPSVEGKYQTINDAATSLLEDLITRKKEKKEIRKKKLIQKQKDRIKKRIELIDDPEIARRKGDAVLAYIDKVANAEQEVELPDPADPTKKLIIKTDPRLSPQKLAQRYYQKYRKDKKKLENLKRLLQKPIKVKEKEKQTLPYHQFHTENGLEVLVGKNNRSNLLITFEIAHPKDIFFHVRGHSGAHVILRTKGKTPSRRDVEEAAGYAVRFSRAKHSSHVPVSYATRADIKKGKPSGLVIFKKEKVIFADPKEL